MVILIGKFQFTELTARVNNNGGFSMTGIICLTPLLSELLKQFLVPLWNLSGLDLGILGGILAIDMGGHQLSMELANAPSVGQYAGIVAGATFGCTVTIPIPVGMGMFSRQEWSLFARGMLIGMVMLGSLPVAEILRRQLEKLSAGRFSASDGIKMCSCMPLPQARLLCQSSTGIHRPGRSKPRHSSLRLTFPRNRQVCKLSVSRLPDLRIILSLHNIFLNVSFLFRGSRTDFKYDSHPLNGVYSTSISTDTTPSPSA